MVGKSWIALVCTVEEKRDDAGFFIACLFSYITVSFSQKARLFFFNSWMILMFYFLSNCFVLKWEIEKQT